ncbi:MAG: hypothetical protein A2289_26660 [Deltaproteobacteria bacterium RIFOXYA12_FULL_58_15]|nr:MAG: hypothetical protein A2289_26660 [Deltaproteobacteria bacterium RIFOXYA12_FULL_58_15]OGR09507.1 MAG: hypothetical protein A2341_01730 [Deltaproteobacteria bacterium RIFOXYB12_FULL_58_9]
MIPSPVDVGENLYVSPSRASIQDFMRASLLIVMVASVGGCALLQKAQTPAPKAEVVEDEESGVEGVGRILKEFRKQLSAKSFDEATRLILRAEKSVKNASDLTRAHPDFEDIAESVSRFRQKLEVAIEEDRIARREAAIDDLIHQAEGAERQGSTLFSELSVRVPTVDDVTALAEIVGTFTALRAEGRKFEDQPRYKQHAVDRDKQAEQFEKRLSQARWQLEAGKAVGSRIDDAYNAAMAVSKAESSAERIVAFQKAADDFSGCVTAVTDLEGRGEYQDTWLIETRLGMHSIGKTKKLCTERSGQARREGYKLDWHNKVLDVVEAIAAPVTRAHAGGLAADALNAAEAAAKVLAICQTTLAGIMRHPGAESRKSFATVLGKLNMAQLQTACANEQGRLEKTLPTLRWRQSLEEVGGRLNETKRSMDDTQLLDDAEKQVQNWRGVIGGLKECIEQAQRIASERGAELSFNVRTEFGKLTAAGMVKECSRQMPLAKEKLTEATRTVQLNQFLKGCRGDEIAVAKREGIPTKIQDVKGGRIFVYEKQERTKNSVNKQFGFDEVGKRIDFRLRWLNEVGSVVSDINRAMQGIAGAPNGTDALKATEAALPVLGNCALVLKAKDEEESPGYDATAVFTTAFGKVAAGALAEKCGTERVRRAQSMTGLKWRIQLEELRDRVGDAHTEFERAKVVQEVAERVGKLGSAIGGYTECIERSEGLVTAQGYDKNLKVKTAFGEQTLAALAKSCQTQLKSAGKELDKAMADKKLEDFVRTCKADEIEVVRRRGLPTRIEDRVGGRIFVFDTSGKQREKDKRFAFDDKGNRVDEKTLKSKPAETPELQTIP